MWRIEVFVGNKWTVIARSEDEKLINELGLLLQRLNTVYRGTYNPPKVAKEAH